MSLEDQMDQFISEAWERHRPTRDDFAEKFWRWSNSQQVPYNIAADTMRKAGYQPFSGFPLVRERRVRERRIYRIQTPKCDSCQSSPCVCHCEAKR